jgi:hypothetical protein
MILRWASKKSKKSLGRAVRVGSYRLSVGTPSGKKQVKAKGVWCNNVEMHAAIEQRLLFSFLFRREIYNTIKAKETGELKCCSATEAN